MRQPLVSIIIPAFNNEETLSLSIDSLAHQKYGEKEIIVIFDEGSTDKTQQILLKLAEKHRDSFHVVSTKHVGRSQARNIGWQHSTGEILFFADADDIYNPDYLDKAVACLISDPKHGGVTVTGASIKFESTFVTECMEVYSKIIRSRAETGALSHDWAWVYRKDAFESVGGFDEHLNQAEDKDLYLRVKKAGYTFGVVTGINWHHGRRGNLPTYLKKRYLAGRRRVLFLLKHNQKFQLLRNVAAFLGFSCGVVLSVFFPIMLLLVSIGIVAMLSYSMFITVYAGWKIVQRKRYLLLYPFLKALTYFAFSFGHVHGTTLVIYEKITGRNLDWSRI